MKIKHVVRFILFSLLCVVVVLNLNSTFGMFAESNTLDSVKVINQFYEEPEETWDGIFVGTSSVNRQWSASLAWHDYGMTVYPMNTSMQPLYLSTFIIEEVRRYQDIDLVIIDIRGIRDSPLRPSEVNTRRVTDLIRDSKIRIAAINRSFDFYEEYYQEMGKEMPKEIKNLDRASFYLPLIKYHSRWEDGLIRADFDKPRTELKGYYEVDNFPFTSGEVERPPIDTTREELSTMQKKILDEIIAYGKEKKVELLFTSSPLGMGKKEQPVLNAALDYLEAAGQKTINFNTDEVYDEMKLDFAQDYYSMHHMNSKGAIKFTSYFAKYLKENYDFEDKRGQEAYKSWDTAYDNFQKFYENGWAAAAEKKK